MTLKDWLTIFIPVVTTILLNGILLFVFQKKISVSMDMKARTQLSNYEIKNKFKQIALSTYEVIQINYGMAIANSQTDMDISGFDQFDNAITGLISFYRVNEPILRNKKNDDAILKLIHTKTECNKLLADIVCILSLNDEEEAEDGETWDEKFKNVLDEAFENGFIDVLLAHNLVEKKDGDSSKDKSIGGFEPVLDDEAFKENVSWLVYLLFKQKADQLLSLHSEFLTTLEIIIKNT